MSNQKILDYIKECENRGFSHMKIKEALFSAGWSKDDVESSFNQMEAKEEDINIKPQKNEEEGIVKQQENPSEIKKKKKFFLSKSELIIIAFIIVSLFAIVYLFFSQYLESSAFEKNMSRSINAMTNLDSISYEASLRVDMIGNEGIYNFTFSDKDEAYVIFNVNGDTHLKNNNNSSSLFLGLKTNLFEEYIDLGIDTINIDNKFYFRFSNLPDLVNDFIDQDIIKNWLEIDLNDDDFINIDKFNNQESVKNLSNIILNNLDINELIIVLEEDELLLNNIDTYYYHLSFNKEAMPDFLINVYRDIYNHPDLRDLFFIDKKTNDFWLELRQEMIDDIENIELYSFELWIDKETYLPHKISINTDFNHEQTSMEIKLKIDLLLKNINEDINIDIPENTIKLDELLDLLLGPSISFDQEPNLDFDFSDQLINIEDEMNFILEDNDF